MDCWTSQPRWVCKHTHETCPTRVDLSVHYTVGRGLVRSCRRAAIGAVLHVPVSPTLTEIDRAPHPDVCQSRGDRR